MSFFFFFFLVFAARPLRFPILLSNPLPYFSLRLGSRNSSIFHEVLLPPKVFFNRTFFFLGLLAPIGTLVPRLPGVMFFKTSHVEEAPPFPVLRPPTSKFRPLSHYPSSPDPCRESSPPLFIASSLEVVPKNLALYNFAEGFFMQFDTGHPLGSFFTNWGEFWGTPFHDN